VETGLKFAHHDCVKRACVQQKDEVSRRRATPLRSSDPFEFGRSLLPIGTIHGVVPDAVYVLC